MAFTRRMFLKGGSAAAAGMLAVDHLAELLMAAAPEGKLRISSRHFGSDVRKAKEAGLDGLEVGVGGPKKFALSEQADRDKLKEAMKETGVVISSLSMDLLNGLPLQSTGDAPAWVETNIATAKDLGAGPILIPFFGKAHLLAGGRKWKQPDRENLVKRLKDLGPKAKAAGVTLALECTLSGKEYNDLLAEAGVAGVGAYYDIGNATADKLDPAADIRELKDNLTIIHFKDRGKPGWLGEGQVKMEPVVEALKAINYKGWIVLETSCPKGAVESDKQNIATIRRMGL